MVKRKAQTIERRIVDSIIFDLSDRRGLKGEWNMIDDDIKREIIKAWCEIVLRELSKWPGIAKAQGDSNAT